MFPHLRSYPAFAGVAGMRDFFAHTFDLLLKGLAAAGGFLAGVSGNGSRRCVVLLAVLMVADYVSGVVAGALGKSDKTARGKLSSSAGWKGLLRKCVILLMVCLAYALDWFVNQGNVLFLTAVAWFYIGNEALSLVENLALCGVPIPAKLKNALEGFSRKEK